MAFVTKNSEAVTMETAVTELGWTLWLLPQRLSCCICWSGPSGGLRGHLELRVKGCRRSGDASGSQRAAEQVSSRLESEEETIGSSEGTGVPAWSLL